jgi:deazaflavin-dependent oxidoreductase (nitroreductase family)
MPDQPTALAGENDDSKPAQAPRLPPRWVIRTAWVVHRAIYRLSGGRLGLSVPAPDGKYGTMRLTTIGRHSGAERDVILAYYEDGPNLVTLAMNGWGEGDPAWWLNLKANPDARVVLKEAESRAVRARVAEGQERTRLWNWIRTQGGYGGAKLDGYAALRSTETPVVILEPLPEGRA